tara:strand:- start:734 stop:1366 length:633 start_codon:yes stop_codon:yes gene_type:complete
MDYLIFIFIVFLLCSLNFSAIYISRFSSTPENKPTTHIGASYIWRSHSKFAGLIIFLGDSILKGFFPIFAAKLIFDFDQIQFKNLIDLGRETYLIPIIFAQVLGFNWSIFLKLKGGRGMALIVGIALGLNIFSAIILYVIYILGWLKIRDGGPSWILALLMASIASIIFSTATSISLALCLFLTLLKRVTGNAMPVNYTMIKKRLLFDKD